MSPAALRGRGRLRRGRHKPTVAFAYLLGRYLDLHGKPELAVALLETCLAETEFVADFHRTLAAAELLSRKIRSKPRSRPQEGREKPKKKVKSPPE